MKDQEDEKYDDEDSLGDDGEKDQAMINLADAMNFSNYVDDEFPGSYSL